MVYGSSTITQLFLCSMHITKYVIINIQTVRSAYFYIDIEGQVRAIVWYVTCEWHNCWRYIFVLFFLLFCERTRQELCMYTSNLLMFKVSPNWYCVMYLTKYRIYSYSIYNIQYSRIHICVLYSKEEKGGTGRFF